MKIEKLTNLKISKTWIDFLYTPTEKIDGRVDYKRFKEFIEHNKDFFTWGEETDWGKQILKNSEKHSADTLKSLQKQKACFEAYKKKDYKFEASYINDWMLVSITNINPAKMNFSIIEKLIEMADYCDAQLFGSSKKAITRESIEKMKLK